MNICVIANDESTIEVMDASWQSCEHFSSMGSPTRTRKLKHSQLQDSNNSQRDGVGGLTAVKMVKYAVSDDGKNGQF